jgi:hypothetical protein
MSQARQARLLLAVVPALGAAIALPACAKYPKTPEDALQRIERVVVSGDALAAWELVDRETRAAAESVLADERLMQTIVRAKYPPAEAARELERLAAADEPDAAHFFARTCKTWKLLEGYRKRLGSVSGPIKTQLDAAGVPWVARHDGMAFRLTKQAGGYAWGDLRGEWQLERDRASHAVKTVRDNAALYKKTEGP